MKLIIFFCALLLLSACATTASPPPSEPSLTPNAPVAKVIINPVIPHEIAQNNTNNASMVIF
jgi:hypothetical protein